MNRRHFLKASGTTLALPYLASLNFKAFAKESPSQSLNKMLFLSFGWGVTKETFYASIKERGKYTLPEGLAPLAKHKNDFSIIRNLTNQFNHEAHWGSTFFLTGANRYAIPGKSFNNTISVDQVAANIWGEKNRYSSLQFECKNSNNSGHGPGLSLSWNSTGKPLPGINDPFIMYNKLFGNEKMSVAQKRAVIAQKGSSLDAVLSDVKRVSAKLNKDDKDKLGEYLQSVRDIETRLAKEAAWIGKTKPKPPFKVPSKKGLSGEETIKLNYDLMVAALQTNSTRVATYRQPVDMLLKDMQASITPHNMSHYAKGDRFDVSKKRDLKQSELLSYLFDKLKKTKGVNGKSLFESTTIAYGSNIRSSHFLNDVPAIIAGNTKALKLGAQVVTPKDTPLCNLWLTLLKANGINQESFGDSTGIIDDILV